jgi:polysaccharide deacetylase 2 family uncharacterized protein YibQ
MTPSSKNGKKSAPDGKRRPAGKNSRPPRKGFGRLLIPAGLGLLLAVSLTATLYFVFLRPAIRPGTQERMPNTARIPRSVSPLQAGSATPPPALADRTVAHLKPRVAIVIDDMGYRKAIGDGLLHLDLNLSFSFLPDGPNSATQAREARNLGRDILLHLPLEPHDPTWNLGPGGLYISMSRQTLQNTFARDLAVVPMAIGINNHMGSLFTENETAMRALLTIVRANDLFFLDSITSAKSIGYDLARSMGVKTARRDIFLDNEHDNGKITNQLMKLLAMAEKHNWAIGLAHPFPSTLAALKEHAALFRTRVRLVGISELVQ